MDVEVTQTTIEDGELIDDSDEEPGVYKPLERPLNNVVNSRNALLTKPHINNGAFLDDESDLSSISTDTDSDVDKRRVTNAKKVKINRPHFNHVEKKRIKKYDIWCSHVQEDILTESLVSCDVSRRIDRSRNVESYEHRFQSDLRHKLKRGRKRCYSNRNNAKPVHYANGDNNDEDDDEDDEEETEVKGSARSILDLVATVNSTDEELAKDIANKLYEEKDDLILRIVRIAGKMKAIEIFDNTKRIELDGGMLIMNRTRRRTPGGIFIFLLKRDADLTSEQQKNIFIEERQEQLRERKAKQKAKLQAIKHQMAKKGQFKQNLPELLTRSELTLRKLTTLEPNVNTTGTTVESEPEDIVVKNPPPSPVTDETPTPTTPILNGSNGSLTPPLHRNLNTYSDDFLDLGTTDDMDIF